ncbi:Protein NRT1/ PTR FAMILY 5.1 [Linum perenne]
MHNQQRRIAIVHQGRLIRRILLLITIRHRHRLRRNKTQHFDLRGGPIRRAEPGREKAQGFLLQLVDVQLVLGRIDCQHCARLHTGECRVGIGIRHTYDWASDVSVLVLYRDADLQAQIGEQRGESGEACLVGFGCGFQEQEADAAGGSVGASCWKREASSSSFLCFPIFPLIRCLDKAAILAPTKEGNTKTTPPCTVTQTEETKLIMGMLVIWFVTLIPSTLWAQINTLFVKQGTTLDRTIGGATAFQIPAASLGSFIQISMLITLPFYDRVFVPFMRTRTGNPRGISLLQRLGVGFLIQIAAVAVAYAVEVRRMRVVKTHLYNHHNKPNMTVPMSIFWLLPQYVLLGIGDVFNAVGLMEFFYDQSPEEMRSLGTTFFTSGIGVGNFLNSFLVTVVDKATAGGGVGGGGRWIGNDLNESRLDYYYGFLLVLSGLNLGAFVWASSWYVYKKEEVIVMDHGAIEDGK